MTAVGATAVLVCAIWVGVRIGTALAEAARVMARADDDALAAGVASVWERREATNHPPGTGPAPAETAEQRLIAAADSDPETCSGCFVIHPHGSPGVHWDPMGWADKDRTIETILWWCPTCGYPNTHNRPAWTRRRRS